MTMTQDEVIDRLWAFMPVEETHEIMEHLPELAEAAALAHHNVWHSTTHEERMMLRARQEKEGKQ